MNVGNPPQGAVLDRMRLKILSDTVRTEAGMVWTVSMKVRNR